MVFFALTHSLQPNLSYKNVSEIPFNKLKDLGIRYILFDRDNTLTKHLENNTQYNDILEKIKPHFQEILLVSNSRIDEEYQLGIKVAQTTLKKPFNYPEIKEKYLNKNIKDYEVCIIGDRMLTDILMASKHDLLGILVQPIDTSKENLGIQIMRKIESLLSKKKGMHSYYGYLNF